MSPPWRWGSGDLGDGGSAKRLVPYLLQGGRQLDAADGGILKGAGMDYGDGIFDAGNLDMFGDDNILAREVGCGGTPHADASGLVVDDIVYAIEIYLSRMARDAGRCPSGL